MRLQVSVDRGLPVVSTGSWDGAAAKAAIFRWAGFEGDNPSPRKAAKLFLYYDADEPYLKGSYHFPVGTIRGGKPVISEEGMAAAAGYLPKGDAPDSVKRRARGALDHFYRKRDKQEQKSLAIRVPYPWH